MVERGVAALIDDASRTRAGRVGPFNTDPALREVELASIRTGRALSLAPYNDYRELASFPRATAFDQISGDPQVQALLEELYGTVDRIELFPGLFAEDARPNSVLPSLIGRMVGVDAFSQALTNPLLAPRVFNARDVLRARDGDHRGHAAGCRTSCTATSRRARASYLVTMTREGWVRE